MLVTRGLGTSASGYSALVTGGVQYWGDIASVVEVLNGLKAKISSISNSSQVFLGKETGTTTNQEGLSTPVSLSSGVVEVSLGSNGGKITSGSNKVVIPGSGSKTSISTGGGRIKIGGKNV